MLVFKKIPYFGVFCVLEFWFGALGAWPTFPKQPLWQASPQAPERAALRPGLEDESPHPAPVLAMAGGLSCGSCLPVALPLCSTRGGGASPLNRA